MLITYDMTPLTSSTRKFIKHMDTSVRGYDKKNQLNKIFIYLATELHVVLSSDDSIAIYNKYFVVR